MSPLYWSPDEPSDDEDDGSDYAERSVLVHTHQQPCGNANCPRYHPDRWLPWRRHARMIKSPPPPVGAATCVWCRPLRLEP